MVVKNITDADAERAEKSLALAEQVGENNGRKLGRTATRRQAAVENHINPLLNPESAADHDYEIVVDSKKYPGATIRLNAT